jgi:hypothetical protein
VFTISILIGYILNLNFVTSVILLFLNSIFLILLNTCLVVVHLAVARKGCCGNGNGCIGKSYIGIVTIELL